MSYQRSSSFDSGDFQSVFDVASPERTLVAAVLERAVRDVLDGDTEAYGWFSDDEGDEKIPFSFLWICEQLEVDPNHVRLSLERREGSWAKRKLKAA